MNMIFTGCLWRPRRLGTAELDNIASRPDRTGDRSHR